MAESGAAPVALASVDRETTPEWTFRSPGDTAVIVRQLIGLGAITICAVVPLWTARAVLGAIVTLLHQHRDQS
jgi:hypothetical protein